MVSVSTTLFFLCTIISDIIFFFLFLASDFNNFNVDEIKKTWHYHTREQSAL